MLEPQNRRYIGNKYKLTADIQGAVDDAFGDRRVSFADLFAGTGAVGYHFAKRGDSVVVNDTLYANVVAYKAWFSEEEIDEKRVVDVLRSFNSIDVTVLNENYFSEIYGGKYYSTNNARAIGYIRDEIEAMRGDVTEREYYVLLASLLFYADKTANTVGHFEHYLKRAPNDKPLGLEMLNLSRICGAQIYNEDANDLARKTECDVVYIDPPYNARQYVNFYHVLENLARWDKPDEFEGISMKFKRNHLKSGYSRAKAPELFADLLGALKCKLIVVSYNNTYDASSTASNNRIQEDFLMEQLSKRGATSVKGIAYKAFSVGTTNFVNHLEKLYICKVEG